MARAMKDSGIPWVGDIPESWNCKRIKYLASYNDEVLEESTSDDYEFSYIDIGSVEYGKGITQYQKMQFKDAPSRARRVVRRNDIIVSTVRTYLKAVATVPFSDVPQIASTGFIVLRAREDKVLPDFLKYAVLSDAFISLVEAKSVGISYPAINASEIVNLSIPTPSLLEQKRIANLLDTECERIDAVMEQTRASIEEYKKLKQSIITEAVTKGIRPNRPMKDSGIDWIKEIPVEWNSIHPKALFSQRKERAAVGERQLTASQQFGVVFQDEYMEKTGAKVVTVEKDFDILKHVEKGDFVISMRSFQGGLEYSENTGSISSAYVMLIPNLKYVFPRFFRWLLKSAVYINALQSTSNMVRDGQAMRYSNFAQVRLYTVPLEEQKQIADYLDKECDMIDSLIQRKEAFLSEMESYKKSLIFEYVTGKKDAV